MILATSCPDLTYIPDVSPEPRFRHGFVQANGIRFHYVQAGPENSADDRPLVLLLHGFPDLWYSWRHQLSALGERFRVVAPDLRGYHLTDWPSGGYSLPNLTRDVASLVQALGAERAHIVGHDWGGVLAWATAMSHPSRVERLAVINAPHPAAYLREIRRSWRQRARSWYVLFFQLPRLADWLLERDRAALIATALRGTAVNESAFRERDLEVYRHAFGRPGALRGPLAYYRALGRFGLSRFEAATRRIDAPTLLVWGLQDRALVPELTEGLETWVPNLRVVREPQSGHWLQQEQPELVNRELRAFLTH